MMGGYGAEMAGSGMMGGGMMGGYSRAAALESLPDYQLFRFFDFNVRPGKYYKYRVRLWLANPNYQLPPQYLADENSAESQYMETDWSNETGPVPAPLDSRVLVGNVRPAANALSEPSGKILAVHFDESDGTELAEEFTVARGQMANFLQVPKPEKETAPSMFAGGMEGYGTGPEGSEGGGAMETMGMYGGGFAGAAPKKRDRKRERKKPEEPPELIDYVTQLLLLDMSGGQRQLGRDRNLLEPGRYLFLDPAGNLVIHSELRDLDEYRDFKPVEVKKKKEKPEEGLGPEGMMEGMFGPFGGQQ